MIIQGMYTNDRSRVRVMDSIARSLELGLAYIRVSVLSALLFILVLEAGVSHWCTLGATVC